MAGKWSKFKNKLKKFQPEKKWQEKVDEAKVAILGVADNPRDANVAFLARQFATRRKKRAALEDKVHALNTELEALSQLLVDRLEDEEQQAVELRGGITVSLKDDIYPMMVDRQKLFAWIKATRQVELLTIHPSTFKAVVKATLEGGRPLPPGAEVFFKTTATCRGLRLNGGDNGDE